MITSKESFEELNRLYLDHPDGKIAKDFYAAFNSYSNKVDDLIDEGASNEQILEVLHDAYMLYTMPFFVKYSSVLLPVINYMHHTYADSVIMEHSTILWHREHADCLRLIGVEMILTISQLLGGYSLRRKISLGIREEAYTLQYGQPT